MGWGGIAGSVLSGGSDTSGYDDLGSYGTHLANSAGFANAKAKTSAGDLQNSVAQQNAASSAVLDTMKQQGQAYTNQMQGTTNDYTKAVTNAGNTYQTQLAGTKSQLQNQANDSNAAYTNTVLPNLQDIIGKDKTNADSAMTLQQAMDPNNAVATATRGMYNDQAQGIQNQGLADYGVLAALGSQATANTIGSTGTPMLGGQMASLQNQNLGAASQAFGNAQTNANNLKLAGISAGQNQSNWAYGAGQDAINSYGNATQQYANANNQKNQIADQYTQQMAGVDQNSYGTSMGQAGDIYNANASQAGLGYGVQNQLNQAQLSQINQQYGTQQSMDNAQIMAANAAQAGKLGAIGGLLGAGAGYMSSQGGQAPAPAAGGAAGGPAGAAAASGASGQGGQSPMQGAAQGAQLGSSIFQGGFGAPQAGYQPYNPYQQGAR